MNLFCSPILAQSPERELSVHGTISSSLFLSSLLSCSSNIQILSILRIFVYLPVLFLLLGQYQDSAQALLKICFLLWLQHYDSKLCPFPKISVHEFFSCCFKNNFFKVGNEGDSLISFHFIILTRNYVIVVLKSMPIWRANPKIYTLVSAQKDLAVQETQNSGLRVPQEPQKKIFQSSAGRPKSGCQHSGN